MKNPLKTWREKTGFTRSEAATVLGFNYSFYCQIESGTQAPTATILEALEHVGRESEVCPEVNQADFMLKWARYEADRRRKLLARRRDSPAEARA